MRKPPKLRLVGKGEGDNGASSIFDDIDQLRADLGSASNAPGGTVSGGPLRRPRAAETFARIPHGRALALYPHHIGEAGWQVLFELDRLILAGRGKNPVIFWSPRLREAGLRRNTRARALRRLEEAGVIEVEWRETGLGPLVRHLWHPQRD